MNIIFDIDDTITDETGFMMKYAPRYLKKKYNIEPIVKNPNGYNVAEVFGLKEIFGKEDNLNEEELNLKCNQAINGFWNTYYLKYMLYPIKKGAKETITKLKDEGNNIYFLTSRGKKTKENDTFINEFIRLKIVPFLTKFQLKINGINYNDYNQLKLVQNEEEKIQFINKIKARFVFDDQVSLLGQLPEFSKPICVETSHTDRDNLSSDIILISSYENNQIESIIKQDEFHKKKNKKRHNNIKFYEKAFTENFYVLIRNLGKNIFLDKFQPIVHGVEHIPNDKRAVVYVGNHRNSFDPLIATLFIENPTHWAALLRLFEAKENLFGRDDIYILRKLSSLLIKSMGSIPIARPTDENYKRINLESLMKIDSYIKMGSSIGFYPEGTHNRKPEEVNILPLASDAIFNIARLNESWLQPISIVWTPDDIKIPNKVIIDFPEAIETTAMTTEEIRYIWENSLNDSIEDAKLFFEQIRSIEKNNQLDKESEKQLVIRKFTNQNKNI